MLLESNYILSEKASLFLIRAFSYNIPINIMCERFQEFVSDLNTDNRIISILGNHDLSTYIIPNDCTNRTVRFGEKKSIITDCIKQITPQR